MKNVPRFGWLLFLRPTRSLADALCVIVGGWSVVQIDTSGDDKTNNALRLLTRYEFLNAVVRIARARAPAQFKAEPAECVRIVAAQ